MATLTDAEIEERHKEGVAKVARSLKLKPGDINQDRIFNLISLFTGVRIGKRDIAYGRLAPFSELTGSEYEYVISRQDIIEAVEVCAAVFGQHEEGLIESTASTLTNSALEGRTLTALFTELIQTTNTSY